MRSQYVQRVFKSGSPYVVRASRNISTASPPLMDLKESLNKGLGMFALRDIPAFTELASDKAMMSLGPADDLPEAFQQYQKLTNENKTLLLNLHSFHKPERDARLSEKLLEQGYAPETIPEMVKVSSVFTSNAFNVDAGIGDGALNHSLFSLVSRINHSCVPNAHTNYDPETARMAVYSILDIPIGREIEIAYFNMLLPLDQRQARAIKWGFQCACPACAPVGCHVQEAHEARRAHVREIEQQFAAIASSDNVSGADLRQCIEKSEEMLGLISEDESLLPQLPIAYDYLATFQIIALQVTQDNTLTNSIQQNLDLALRAEINITGGSSPSSKQRRKKKALFQGQNL